MDTVFYIASPMLFPVWGLAAFACAVLATSIPVSFYRGNMGQKYNAMNHFVSELGEEGVSKRAAVFNYGLIISGALLAVFFVQLGRSFGTTAGYVLVGAGALMSAFIMLVGVFPMNKIKPHIGVATVAFFGGAAAFAALGTAILTDPQIQLPLGFAVASYAVSLNFILFILIPTAIEKKFLLEPITDRPKYWYLPIMEWATVIITMSVVAAMCIYILIQPQWTSMLTKY